MIHIRIESEGHVDFDNNVESARFHSGSMYVTVNNGDSPILLASESTLTHSYVEITAVPPKPGLQETLRRAAGEIR